MLSQRKAFTCWGNLPDASRNQRKRHCNSATLKGTLTALTKKSRKRGSMSMIGDSAQHSFVTSPAGSSSNRRRFIFVLAQFLILLCALATPRSAYCQAAAPALDAAAEAKISKLLADSGAPSVSIAIVERGQPAYAKAF